LLGYVISADLGDWARAWCHDGKQSKDLFTLFIIRWAKMSMSSGSRWRKLIAIPFRPSIIINIVINNA